MHAKVAPFVRICRRRCRRHQRRHRRRHCRAHRHPRRPLQTRARRRPTAAPLLRHHRRRRRPHLAAVTPSPPPPPPPPLLPPLSPPHPPFSPPPPTRRATPLSRKYSAAGPLDSCVATRSQRAASSFTPSTRPTAWMYATTYGIPAQRICGAGIMARLLWRAPPRRSSTSFCQIISTSRWVGLYCRGRHCSHWMRVYAAHGRMTRALWVVETAAVAINAWAIPQGLYNTAGGTLLSCGRCLSIIIICTRAAPL